MEYSICRLCLGVFNENQQMYMLTQECEILIKFRTYLTFTLTTDKGLPDKLCQKCVNTSLQVIEFCSKIKENEQTLTHHLEKGTLTNYYLHLNNNVLIKEESKPIVSNKIPNENVELIEKERIPNGETKENSKSNIDVKVEDNINNEPEETIYNSTDDDVDNEDFSLFKQAEESPDVVKSVLNNRDVIENTSILITDSKRLVLDKYSCLTCNKVCETHEQLRHHYNEEHTDRNNKKIEPTCTKVVVNGKVMYKCDVCSKIYSRKYLKRHLLNHSNVRPYVCKLCSRTYTTVSDIMRHGLRVHSGIKMLCAYKCGFSSAYTGALKEHEDRVHKNMYKYTCEKCGKGFQVKTWYDQHQNIHTGLKPFVCDICGHAFHMEKYLTTHRGKMHPQTLDSKRLICVHCDLKCETEGILTLHLETEHGVTRKKSDRRKKALCDLCGKILNRPEELVLHHRMHSGQKPYKCSICSKLFPRKFSMQVHERSHSRTNSHECAHCGKRYSQQSALYRHQRQQHALPLKRSKTSDNS